MTAPAPVAVEPLLRAEDLRIRRGHDEVLRGIELEITSGEVLAIVGPNGAGKSTLLQALGGLLRPDAGQIECRGRVATALQSPDLARRSALANVELALAWWGVPRADRRARATDALTAIHADHLADRQATLLSGGEQRRVHLARAIAVRPDILLLDEPFAGLDVGTRAELLDDTASALRASAAAVAIVVHDRTEAWALADRLVVLLDGRVAAEGSPRSLLDRPPSPDVARFLGFNGELRQGDEIVLTRPNHVLVDPAGDLTGVVSRLTPLEDGARAELIVAGGRLSAVVPFPGVAVGDTLRLRLVGGARYPAEQVAGSTDHI